MAKAKARVVTVDLTDYGEGVTVGPLSIVPEVAGYSFLVEADADHICVHAPWADEIIRVEFKPGATKAEIEYAAYEALNEHRYKRIAAEVMALIGRLRGEDRVGVLRTLPICLECGRDLSPGDVCHCDNDE